MNVVNLCIVHQIQQVVIASTLLPAHIKVGHEL